MPILRRDRGGLENPTRSIRNCSATAHAIWSANSHGKAELKSARNITFSHVKINSEKEPSEVAASIMIRTAVTFQAASGSCQIRAVGADEAES